MINPEQQRQSTTDTKTKNNLLEKIRRTGRILMSAGGTVFILATLDSAITNRGDVDKYLKSIGGLVFVAGATAESVTRNFKLDKSQKDK